MTAASAGRDTPPWAAWCLIASGVAAGAIWIVFTQSHGPTSYNENRTVLGGNMYFWGWLLGTIPNALLVAGLLGLRPMLLAGAGKVARTGYVLALIGLAVAGALDLIWRALGPPLLVPVQALGLVLLGVGPPAGGARRPRADVRAVIAVVGILLTAAFGLALIPLDVFDRIHGYRIYGAMAHLATGIGWVVAGLLCLRPTRPAEVAASA